MKTSVMQVRDMLSVLSVPGVEKRIGEVPGVESVTVDHAAGNATVRYDETRLDIADIKSDVRQSGYEADASAAAPAGKGHEDHKAPGAPPATPATPAVPKASAGAPSTAGAASQATPKPSPGAEAVPPAPGAPKPAPDAGATPPAGDGPPDKTAPDKK